jgi:mRNA interferase MazF
LRKDLPGWHIKKTSLDGLVSPVNSFKERQIWWVSVGHNVGVEIDGKGPRYARPVIVMRKFSHNAFFGVPLTTTGKENPYLYAFSLNGVENKAALSQVRVFDARRLINKMGYLTIEDYAEVQRQLVDIVMRPPQ